MSAVSPSSPVLVAMDIVQNANGEPARADSPFVIRIAVRLTQRRLRLDVFDQRFADRFALLDELDLAHGRETSPCRNEMAHDDVLLEAAQTIDLAERCRFGEDARGVLERCRGNKAVGLE